jgi:GT2 family glycosyltransferase
MPPVISLSIIICTCNRAASLLLTLNALGKVRIPASCKAEVIIVDNASTDGTAEVVRNTMLNNLQIVYLFEPRKGKSNALNTAVANAQGEIFVFTDDDVLPSEDWIEQILDCFLQTRSDAIVGKVKLAPHLERPWMRSVERSYLAVIEFESGVPIEIVGANAAFRRPVLERVREFDPELGPGALGLGEDTLFGRQLIEAGFKVEYAERAIVVHQPDKSRLNRGAWLHAATQSGRSKAYQLHHWDHIEIKGAAKKWLWFLTKLKLRRMLQPPPPLSAEGCPPWEHSYVHDLAIYRQYCIERRRPRNYARRGLIKLGAGQSASIGVARTTCPDRGEQPNT